MWPCSSRGAPKNPSASGHKPPPRRPHARRPERRDQAVAFPQLHWRAPPNGVSASVQQTRENFFLFFLLSFCPTPPFASHRGPCHVPPPQPALHVAQHVFLVRLQRPGSAPRQRPAPRLLHPNACGGTHCHARSTGLASLRAVIAPVCPDTPRRLSSAGALPCPRRSRAPKGGPTAQPWFLRAAA